ncbi:MAG: 50S ribosomal protein L11 methyltransferase [Fibrobacterales bacterium]|nr:50S ribosomal protein L11 methyltransferase [Fibrobacterales bacterium]
MPKGSDYYWVEYVTPTEELELNSWRLFEAGAPAVEELDVPGDPSRRILRVSVGSRELAEHIASSLPTLPCTTGSAPDQDWDVWWRSQQHPIDVTPHLRVRPPWVETPPKLNALDLVIEAKMAFGTGHHETTRLAALLMELHLPAVRPCRVLDIGTGTGILAMYARHMGADPVGTEIDPVCVECLHENWTRNGFGEPRAILGPLEALRTDPPFHAVVCNMIRSEVWPLREAILDHLAPDGVLILSGQLLAEKEIVLGWFAEAGFETLEERGEGEWWAVAAKRGAKKP